MKPTSSNIESVCDRRPTTPVLTMDLINEDGIFEFNPDTKQFVAQQYNLDQSDRMEEAIAILKNWLDKQTHIIKKDYSQEYMERIIIHSKGSVERAKLKLDKTATYRTLLPMYFEPIPAQPMPIILKYLTCAFIPKLTNEHYRVFIGKITGKDFGNGFLNYYRHLVMICEYILAQDYCNGIVAVLDYTDTNVFEVLKAINVTEMHQTLKIIMDAYSMRIKGIHMITTSKAIDSLVALFKQVVSAKMADRIHVHSNYDSLHKYIAKEILPKDYDGHGKSLSELSSNLMSTLSTEKNMQYFKEMQRARTNETYRRDDKFNEMYLGTPGSFRRLNVD